MYDGDVVQVSELSAKVIHVRIVTTTTGDGVSRAFKDVVVRGISIPHRHEGSVINDGG
jgi:hypothetical protein